MRRTNWNSGISRRKFLSYLSYPAALSLAAPNNLLAMTDVRRTKNVDYFEFVDRNGLGPRVDAPTVEEFFYPLHCEQKISAQLYQPNEVEMIKSILKSEYEREGYDWDDSYELSYSYQHFGVHDNSSDASKLLLSYCERVFDYLYSRLDGLFNVDMSWQLLPSETHPESTKDNVFQGKIGRYTYYVMRVYVDHSELDGLPSLINAQPLERAIHYIVDGEFYLPKRATLYVIPGQTSLVAPFSELLHLTFHAPSQSYANKLAETISQQEAQQSALDAGETINEATAIVLAREYIEKYGASERIVTIDNMARSLNSRFEDLNGAIAYINQNGLQKSLDTYLDNPGKYMKLVSSVS